VRDSSIKVKRTNLIKLYITILHLKICSKGDESVVFSQDPQLFEVHWKAIPLSEAAGTCKERGRGWGAELVTFQCIVPRLRTIRKKKSPEMK